MTRQNRKSNTSHFNRSMLKAFRRSMRISVIAASVFFASGLLPSVSMADDLPRYSNGQLQAQYTKVDGKYHGPYTGYHANGTISFKGTYVNGKLQGRAIQYFENGGRRFDGTFNDGRIAGKWTQYYDSGQVYATGETIGSGYGLNEISGPIKTGPWVWYHANGKKAYEASYVKNNIQGEAVKYHGNGQAQYVATFNDGRITGKWTQYYDSGQLYATGETTGSVHGLNEISGPIKTGPWVWHHANGKKSYEASYVKNNIQGEAVQYHGNGQAQYVATFNDGHITGKWTQYYDSGQVYATGETTGSVHGLNEISGPIKQGRWVWHHAKGKKSFEANYIENNTHGDALQFFPNGEKQYEATFVDGWMTGKWTVYHNNGVVRATGEAAGNNYGRNEISGAVKTGLWTWFGTGGVKEYQANYVKNNANGPAIAWHPNGAVKARGTFRDGWLSGPWISYWDNGQVRSKGRAEGNEYERNDIKHPRKVGQWVYLNKDGSLHHANNYVNNASVGQVAASRDEHSGETIIATRNPDGSRTVTTLDDDGNLREVRDPMAVDFETVVATSTDPETGEMTIVRKLPDGTTVTSKGKKTVDENGNEQVVETDENGLERTTTIAADGKVSVERENADGTFSEVVRHADGTVDTSEEAFNGTTTQVRQLPNGDTLTVRRDLTANVLERTRQTPDGTLSRIDQHGNQSRSFTDGEGNTVVETKDRWGNTSGTVTDAQGKVVSREENRVMTPEPGREYFETVLGGTDWNELPESYKRRYADSERQIRENEASKNRQADAEAKRGEEERARLLAEQARSAEDLKKREKALQAEQAEADRAAAARAAREKRAAREREIQASYDQAKDLQKQYDEAIARGDKKEAARIMKLQDEHHEASMDILAYTPDEAAEMNRRQEVRTELANKIGKVAHRMAAYEIAEADGLQDDKEAVTGKTKWLSIGSQMQAQTKKTTRQADHERAYARAKQVEIERLLNDKNTTTEEREILVQMQEMAQLQEEGANRMLSDNAKITAAGYAIDGALVLTGGKLLNASRRGVTAGASKVFAAETAAKVTAVVAERGVLELAGAGATKVATGATTRVLGENAAVTVEKVLTADVSGAAANTAGTVSRRVLGDRVVDATKAGAAKVVEVARTDVRDIPGNVSRAVRGSADEAAEAAGGGLTARVSENATPVNPNAAARPSTAKKPSEMTPTERQAYNDALADQAVRNATAGRTANAADDVAVDGSRTEFIKPPSKMTRAERQAYNDRMAERAVAANRETPITMSDDLLPGPSEAAAGSRSRKLSQAELERLHEPGRALTVEEMAAKTDIYRAREAARRAAEEAAENGRPVAEIQVHAREYEAIRNRINAARRYAEENARSRAAAVDTNTPTIVDRAPTTSPTGTAVLRPSTTEVIKPHETAVLKSSELPAPRLATSGSTAATGDRLASSQPARNAVDGLFKPHETTVLKAHELPNAPAAAPTHGNPTMELETLRDFAKNPRVRTKAEPQRIERLSDYRIPKDKQAAALNTRSEWLRLPSSQRNKLDGELRAAIDEAAAMGDKWAKRLQNDLNNGTFNFSYEPGLVDSAGLAHKDGMALINPMNGKAVRSGDELASTVLHEYVHLYKGRVKFATETPGFEGAANIGQGNEVRAFLSEAIFNRNLIKARMLNGKPFDPTVAKELSSMMKVSELMSQHVPAGAPNSNGIQALRNMQRELVDKYYGPLYKDNPLRAAERLSTFRGGSRENINKYIREQILKGDRTPDQILADVLTKIRNEGGRFSL
jgi:antitoxin component YwqK of YwqJK toxin-antitoxin module